MSTRGEPSAAAMLGCEQRAASAVAEERVRARIEAACGQPRSHRLDHPGERELPDAPCRLVARRGRAAARRARTLRAAASTSSPMSPPRKRVGVDVAEHDERVGDGGFGTAAAVARGAGHRAGRPGTDPQHAARVDPADRAAARTDRVDVDERQRGPDAHELAAAATRRLPSLDDRHVEARAPHVAGDDVVDAGCVATRRGGRHTRRGPGFREPDRQPARLGDGDRAAAECTRSSGARRPFVGAARRQGRRCRRTRPACTR